MEWGQPESRIAANHGQPGRVPARHLPAEAHQPASRCTLTLSAGVVAHPYCAPAQLCADTPPGQAWNQITYERWNGIGGGKYRT
ncbi:hypothetical protein [Salmonirosea aquatica]|uniref:Uncharacterized protein n=1 Tax=Salmonirosea aquatica TaxID=2654236 RepID=A0A7C9FWU8_9BACT|nr:hypothetical protein [Cytophagaceae bacterium SJW1-29]